MTQRDRINPPGPSATDEPPDYIERNRPEDAIADTDPDRSLLDKQDPDAGIKEIREPNRADRHSPEGWGD